MHHYYVIYTVPSLIATNDNVTVLSGQNVTLECLPSNLSLAVNWYFEIDGLLIPLLDGEQGGEQDEGKRNIIFRRIISKFPYHQITLDEAEVADSGVYRCSIVPPIPTEDNTVIAQRITVTVLPGQ